MGGVFVNYRTGDGEWAAKMIDGELCERFGADQVFYASRSIRPGEDFRRVIRKRAAECDVLLAVIGKRWLAPGGDGRRALDHPDDMVREEIRIALRHNVRVIPVLLDDVPRLSPADLPADLVDVAFLQYVRLNHREPTDREIAQLVDELSALPKHATEPWRVRICDTAGRIRGAGVALAGGYVLTCAHVLTDAGGKVVVDFVGLPHTPSLMARVRPDRCVRQEDDRRGDVALLELERRPPDGVGATLRRAALSWDRPIRVCGFPHHPERGVHTRATLTGQDGQGGEWLRLVARSPEEQRVRTGFSGAGVVDDRTGDVLGIVVGESAGLSWMIPVETIVSHLPRVAEWVTGDAVADEVFTKPTGPEAGRAGVERDLTAWLARPDTGDSVMIVVGPDVSGLYRIITRSSREQRSGAPAHPEGPWPAIGSIDLAVDASGRSADDVARRVLNRAGIPLDGEVPPAAQLRAGVPPMTIVVDGVDEARRPLELLADVLEPLAGNGSRLVLGFRAESSPALAAVRSWDVGKTGYRLERLAERIGELRTAEQAVISLRNDIRLALPAGYEATALQVALSELRTIAAGRDEELTRRFLDRCERKTARALRRSDRLAAQLREALGERGVLRGGLGAYQAKANADGLVEDVGIAGLYRTAYEALWRSPTDVVAAREAVREYRLAIRRARGDGGEQDDDGTL